MKEILLDVLSVAYVLAGVIGLIAYWPTIKDLYYYKKPSANINSYVLWVMVAGITFLYSLFILPDLLFRIMSGVGFSITSLVLFLSVKLRDNH